MTELQRVLIHVRWRLQSFTVMGFLFGMVLSHAPFSWTLVVGLVAWLLLVSGITVFNSYYDKDYGPVAGLAHPPVVTRGTLVGAWVLKALGFGCALFLNKIFIALYCTHVALSVLYSHVAFRWKSRGVVAVLFNMIIGASTFIAACTFSTISLRGEIFGALAASFFLAAMYLMMQVHQKDEDRERGDFSVAVMYGERRTTQVAVAALITGIVFALLAFVVVGIRPTFVAAFAIYFVGVLALVVRWYKKFAASASDFAAMNTLTLRISYATNALLATLYLIQMNIA